MMFNRRKYEKSLYIINHSQNKRQKREHQVSNECIEFSQEESEPIINQQKTNTHQSYTFSTNDKAKDDYDSITFLHQKRNAEQEHHIFSSKGFISFDNESLDDEYQPKIVPNNINNTITNPDAEDENKNSNHSDSNDVNFNDILQDKIRQIKEIKENQRKCLLQENEEGIYGKNKAPKDMINDIYQLMADDGDNSDECESDNEKMINQWEKEQYKSGINSNKILIDNPLENIDKQTNLINDFGKIKSKLSTLDIKDIIANLSIDIKKDDALLEVYNKRKTDNNEEIIDLKNNESIFKSKIDYYINQYYRLKNVFFEILQLDSNTSDLIEATEDKDADNDDYYLSS